jgi:uncharacterized protein
LAGTDDLRAGTHYNVRVTSGQLCVHCQKRPVEPLWRPFCSERCKLLDLGKWIDGKYRIPAEPVPSPDGEAEEDPNSDEEP